MKKIIQLSVTAIVMLILFSIAFMGCGGSGGPSGGSAAPFASIKVTPATRDLGTVTVANAPAPCEVKITNDGTAKLTISSITVSDNTNFELDLKGGSTPCGSASSAVAVGDTCRGELYTIKNRFV